MLETDLATGDESLGVLLYGGPAGKIPSGCGGMFSGWFDVLRAWSVSEREKSKWLEKRAHLA